MIQTVNILQLSNYSGGVQLKSYSKISEKILSFFDHHPKRNLEKSDIPFKSPNIELLESG